jgi:DNA (cytosine-5)-methyltransferase 1
MKYLYKAIDLFAGIGGLRLGFEQVFKQDIKFVFCSEIDKFCCKTYEANFGENPQGDIKEVNIKEIPDFDILLAGFPCQAFSIAGKKKGFNDERGNMFFYIRDILKEKEPMAFILENVKNLLRHDKGRTFEVIRNILKRELGYTIYYKVRNAIDFGLPQKRERIFIVGFRDNILFRFPVGDKLPVNVGNILEKNVDLKYFLSQQYLNSLKKHKLRHKAKGNGFGYQVLNKNGIANTIVCGGMGKERNLIKDKITYDCWKSGLDLKLWKNNEGIRKMTPKEWARLQGFPEEFTFPVSMTQSYKQIANSVSIPVIKAIALEIKKRLEKKKEKRF